MTARHVPVLCSEVAGIVQQGPGRLVLDATVGLGGHAAAILGVDELVFWDYPDGTLTPTPELVERIGALLAIERPDILYRPSINEIHPDHWALGVAVEEALRRRAFYFRRAGDIREIIGGDNDASRDRPRCRSLCNLADAECCTHDNR